MENSSITELAFCAPAQSTTWLTWPVSTREIRRRPTVTVLVTYSGSRGVVAEGSSVDLMIPAIATVVPDVRHLSEADAIGVDGKFLFVNIEVRTPGPDNALAVDHEYVFTGCAEGQ